MRSEDLHILWRDAVILAMCIALRGWIAVALWALVMGIDGQRAYSRRRVRHYGR